MISSTINSRRTAIVAAAATVALGAASFTGVANAAENTDATGSLSGISNEEDSSFGSSEGSIQDFFGNEAVQAGGVLFLGLGVAAALAVGAGLQGGAFNDVQLPF